MPRFRTNSESWTKRCGRILATVALFRLYGCTIGPQIRQEVVFVRTVDSSGKPVSVARVAENRKVKVIVLDKDGKPVPTVLDVGGWNVSLPEPVPEQDEPKKEPGK